VVLNLCFWFYIYLLRNGILMSAVPN
jgi:hypothetical protein